MSAGNNALQSLLPNCHAAFTGPSLLPERTSGRIPTMHERILVVDDEPDVVELIGFNLRSRGYEVISASNGLEALLKTRRFHPDLVVLDVMMDGMDGLSVCEILRTQPATRSMPVIIVTAAAGEMAKLNSFSAGATDFMTKPFSPQDLVRKVGRLLESAPRQSQRDSDLDDPSPSSPPSP